jgi:hypothetical protein
LTTLASAVDACSDLLTRLELLRALLHGVREVEREAVEAARAAGQPWSRIGSSLGISKQAVSQRFPGRSREVQEPERDAAHEPTPASTDAKKPTRPKGWLVTTPGGRTLLRLNRQ